MSEVNAEQWQEFADKHGLSRVEFRDEILLTAVTLMVTEMIDRKSDVMKVEYSNVSLTCNFRDGMNVADFEELAQNHQDNADGEYDNEEHF